MNDQDRTENQGTAKQSVSYGREDALLKPDRKGAGACETVTVFDFSDAAQRELWRPVNDVIMGGVSSSTLRESANGCALFTGRVSLEQGGGFASVRTIPVRMNFNGFAGLALTVRGDARTYKINLTDHRSPRGLQYQVRFDPGSDEWVTIRIPFTDLAPTNRGQILSQQWALDLTNIRTLGLMIGDRQEGPFALEIREIRSYAASSGQGNQEPVSPERRSEQ